MKKIGLVLIGLILLFLDLPIVTDIFYPIRHLSEQDFFRGMSVEITRIFLGTTVRIDILPDIVGYVLVFVGLMMLKGVNKRFRNVIPAVFIGLLSNILMNVAPYIETSVQNIAKLVIGCMVVEMFAYALLLFYIGRGIFIQTDQYMYSELWNELKSSWDIVVISPIFVYFMRLLAIFNLPMVDLMSIVGYGIYLFANMSFVYTAFSYCKKLKLFDK